MSTKYMGTSRIIQNFNPSKSKRIMTKSIHNTMPNTAKGFFSNNVNKYSNLNTMEGFENC